MQEYRIEVGIKRLMKEGKCTKIVCSYITDNWMETILDEVKHYELNHPDDDIVINISRVNI